VKKPQIISIILIFAAVVTIMASVVVYFDNDEDTKSIVSVQSSSEVSQAALNNSETVETSLVTSSAVVSLPTTASTVSVSSIAAVSSKPNSSSKSSAKASVSTSPAVMSQAAASSANSTAPSAASAASSSPVLAASSETVSPMSEVVRLINIERAKEGLTALTEMSDIDKAANIRASEIVISFSHQRPSGEEWYTVFAEVGIAYKGVGENLAAGQTTPAEVVTAWMNSEGHRTNIMNASYTKIGVGYVTGGTYGHYWTQLFAR